MAWESPQRTASVSTLAKPDPRRNPILGRPEPPVTGAFAVVDAQFNGAIVAQIGRPDDANQYSAPPN